MLPSRTFSAEVTALADAACRRAREAGVDFFDHMIIVCERDDPTGREILRYLSERQGVDLEHVARGLHDVHAAVWMSCAAMAATFGGRAPRLAEVLARPPPSACYWLALIAGGRLQLGLRPVPEHAPVVGRPGRSRVAWMPRRTKRGGAR